jgi:hypothetical protein
VTSCSSDTGSSGSENLSSSLLTVWQTGSDFTLVPEPRWKCKELSLSARAGTAYLNPVERAFLEHSLAPYPLTTCRVASFSDTISAVIAVNTAATKRFWNRRGRNVVRYRGSRCSAISTSRTS